MSLEIETIRISGGELSLGSTIDEARETFESFADLHLPWHYFSKETGSGKVLIGDLEVQRTPITWRDAIELAPGLGPRRPSAVDESCPVSGLSWLEATHVAERAAQHTGLGFRLLTEAEWEWCAAGPEGNEYPWGNDYDARCCNLAESGQGAPSAVGRFSAGDTPTGLADMAGNVDEWTSTIYAAYDGAHWSTPLTEPWAVDPHVTRGGSWNHHRDLARTRRRHGLYRPETGAGLRLARDAASVA